MADPALAAVLADRRRIQDQRDALAARLTTAETEQEATWGDLQLAYYWRGRALAAEDRVEALEAALHDVLDNMGGHSHWREGGAGGVCETCERQRHASNRARAALACPPQQDPPAANSPPEEEK